MPLRHQRECAAGACECRGDHEVEGDDAVRRGAKILDAKVVFAHRKACQPELRAEQDGREDARKAGGDDRHRIKHKVCLARIVEHRAEQGGAADIEAVRAAEDGRLDQRTVKHHRQRQRQHAEEDAGVAGNQRANDQAEEAAEHCADDNLCHGVGDAERDRDQRHAVAAAGIEKALSERDVACPCQHHDAERDKRLGSSDGRERQRPCRNDAAEQHGENDNAQKSERVRGVLHQMRLATSRRNSPSGLNISTAAMIR